MNYAEQRVFDEANKLDPCDQRHIRMLDIVAVAHRFKTYQITGDQIELALIECVNRSIATYRQETAA